ncbi:MAG: septum formation initiator family protein [Clostridia bacterium]|nr:septum formation initiator family protein [Clostridia bacterium]MCI9085525.1 septum formation initiator family protein [Clostridia bacterium]
MVLMANEYKDRITEYLSEHRKGIKLALFFVLVFAMLFKGVMQIPQIVSGKAEIARLQTQIEYEKERQQEISELKDKVNTDEYIEKIATEKLGLVKSNAKIFVDVSGEQQQ